jgi:CRISPR system Cascade subunit CasC
MTETIEPRFLQIHTLTAYPASLLNRDDVGLAKRMPFGGASRVRVSSQCLKRHWRTVEDEWSLSAIRDLSVRSRITFEERIAQPLIADGCDPAATRAVLAHLEAVLLGESDKAKAAKAKAGGKKGKAAKAEEGGDVAVADVEADDADLLRTKQVIILGPAEIAYLKQVTREILAGVTSAADAEAAVAAWCGPKNADARTNFKALYKASAGAAGLDAALFGRMVTSDILARGDAAVHVAHAFTVHAEEAENDYFSAVDDLLAEAGEHGSGHIGEAELTSGLFYGYVVVDVPLLVANLTGCRAADWKSADRADAARVVEHLIHLIATVSPGAKKGSTAPYAAAELVLVEAGRRQPRSLANAFLQPVGKRADGGMLNAAVRALGGKLAAFDRMYGAREARRLAAMTDAGAVLVTPAGSLDDLAAWARMAVGDAAVTA